MGKVATAEAPRPAFAVGSIRRRPRRMGPRPAGTDQQEAYWSALVGLDAHVRMTARAGTGKSFSCREGIWRLMEADPSVRASYVAFNRAIADEFQAGLPGGATASTMHSAGYAALRNAFDGLGTPDRRKLWRYADDLFRSRDKATRQAKGAAVKLASLCKGYLASGPSPETLARLVASHGVNVPADLRGRVFDAVPRMLARNASDTSSIDFDDMIWLPVMLGLEFPPVDVLFVDEAQDLSPCQHALVRLMAGDGRIAFVGDDRQAIYAFRGADSRSLDSLSGQLRGTARGLVELPLTLTRRCPRSHVALASRLVPDFGAMPGAPGGRVDVDADPAATIEPGWMVLCRTNAPLISLAFGLMGRGVPVSIQGRDLGESLARLVESFDALSAPDLLASLDRWTEAELTRLAEIDGSEEEASLLADQAACVRAAALGCVGAGEVAARLRSLFIDSARADDSTVLLSSVHRAKGREADRVGILSPDQLPHKMARTPEAILQEENLAYVAATRSRHRLSFFGPVPSLFGE